MVAAELRLAKDPFSRTGDSRFRRTTGSKSRKNEGNWNVTRVMDRKGEGCKWGGKAEEEEGQETVEVDRAKGKEAVESG